MAGCSRQSIPSRSTSRLAWRHRERASPSCTSALWPSSARPIPAPESRALRPRRSRPTACRRRSQRRIPGGAIPPHRRRVRVGGAPVKRLAVLSLVSFFACDDSLSSSPSTFRSATTELPMLRIVSAELAADGTTDVTLGWTLPDDPNITSVRLERREGPEEPWSPLVEVPAATSPLFTDAAVPGLRAEYRVVAWAGETEQSASSVRTVTSIAGPEYDLPEVAVPGVPFSTSLFGVVRYPQEPPTAPRPLVVFLHGNHGNCRNPATLEDECAEQTTHECTVEGYDTAPNAHGYVYLQETLAAQGYVTVSLGANALNCRGGGNNW